MGRLVNCFDLGSKIDKDKAYIENCNGKNRFWSSEQACIAWNDNNNNRVLCIDKLMDILGYQEGMKMPTVAYKKLKEFESYGYDVVLDTICNQVDSINYFMNTKSFNSEYGRVAYVFAIIQNNIMDEYNRKKRAKKQITLVDKAPDMPIEISDIGNIKVKKDVSSLLGDI